MAPLGNTGLQWTILSGYQFRNYSINLLPIPEPLPPPGEKNTINPYKLSDNSQYLFIMFLH